MSRRWTSCVDRIPFVAVNAIALHGGPPEQRDYRPVYETMRELLVQVASEITEVDVSAESDSPNAGAIGLEAADRIARIGFGHDTIRITLTRLFWFSNAPMAVCSFGMSDSGFSFSFDRSLMSFDAEYLTNLARQVDGIYPVRYGYATQLSRRVSAWHYGAGRTFTRADYDDKSIERRRRWNAHCANRREVSWLVFRNIYQLNFLSSQHLDLRIGGVRIKDWICEQPSHGDLVNISDHLWAWSIPDSCVPEVRRIFEEHNLLLERPRNARLIEDVVHGIE